MAATPGRAGRVFRTLASLWVGLGIAYLVNTMMWRTIPGPFPLVKGIVLLAGGLAGFVLADRAIGAFSKRD